MGDRLVGWRKRQAGEYPVHQTALGKEDVPGGQEDDLEVRTQGHMLLVPHLQGALVGGDDLPVILARRQVCVIVQGLLIPENDGADSGDAGPDVVDALLHGKREVLEIDFHLGPGPDQGHVPDEDVDNLRQFVELGEAEELAHGRDPRVVAHRQGTRQHVGAVLQHGGELPDAEVPPAITYPALVVKDFPLCGEAEKEDDG